MKETLYGIIRRNTEVGEQEEGKDGRDARRRR